MRRKYHSADSTSDRPVYTESLCKTYERPFGRGRVEALKDLSIDVKQGEIYGLLGPNGAGKTTLLKTLLGVVRPTRGEAFLFGKPVDDPSSRSRIGFLPENHRFPDFLTALQTLSTYGRLAGMRPSTIAERSRSLLDRVGLSDWANVRLKEFSKGMMQRLGLAQSLMNDPDLLFLDEPTDGVDPFGRREIRDLLLELQRNGKTIFLNSHLLSEVELVCTRVGILHLGRMVKTGTVQELTAAVGSYRVRVDASQSTKLREFLELRPLHTEPEEGDESCFILEAGSVGDLNVWIDRLREDGFLIRSIEPGNRSLEDHFLDVISSANESADAAGLSESQNSDRKRRQDASGLNPADDRPPA